MTETQTAKPWTETGRFVSQQVNRLQNGYTRTPRDEWAQRMLAQLRRADAGNPGADPELWQVTLDGMREELLGHGDKPSRSESSAHAALVLYALHQQSKSEPMHRRGVGLGQAVRQLSASRAREGSKGVDPGTLARFHSLVRAQSQSARIYNTRGLIGLLRSSSIPLDYGLLATDLWLLDTRHADGVRLRWGRQLHQFQSPTPSNPTEGEDS